MNKLLDFLIHPIAWISIFCILKYNDFFQCTADSIAFALACAIAYFSSGHIFRFADWLVDRLLNRKD